jgi:hypothetical protein
VCKPFNALHKIAVAVFVLLSFMFDQGSTHASGPEAEGDIHHGPCSQMIGDTEVSLEITPRPVKAMRALHFKVVIRGRSPSQPPFVDLDMPGMFMGPNVVRLKASSAGTYEGRGFIVKCVSRRRDWRATVCLPGIGKARFFFEVVHNSES